MPTPKEIVQVIANGCSILAAVIVLCTAAMVTGAEERGICPFSTGTCMRWGLVAAASQRRSVQIAWWDDRGARQEWDITEGMLKEHVTCPDGEACTLERLRRECWLDCLAGTPLLEAFDPRTRRLYFSLPAYDRRAIMMAADLRARRLSGVLEDRSNGEFVFRQTQLSPAGRYLAYLATSHSSACEDFAVLRVFDLEGKSHLPVPSREERRKRVNEAGVVTSDDGFQWESDGTLAVEQSEWTMQACTEDSTTRTRRVVRVQLPR